MRSIQLIKGMITAAWMMLAIPLSAQKKERGGDECPMVKLEVEELPSLHVPRAGHVLFVANGEVVVVGGHTTGFVPTPTAEYFHNGKWHLMEMNYEHDNAAVITLSNGDVLLAGGSEQHLGIGQTFVVERYNAKEHSFNGFGCLDQKRALSCAAELDSGKVVVSGNWYAKDCIEIFDGKKYFSFVKDVKQQRAFPYVLRTARNDAIMFSSLGSRADIFDTIWVDALQGEPFTVPLFDEWIPQTVENKRCELAFIGDTAKEEYVNLILLRKRRDETGMTPLQKLLGGQLAIGLVEGRDFSLLPLKHTIPMVTNHGDSIQWTSNIFTDRNNRRAYVAGVDRVKRMYVLCIQYDQRPAPIVLYYTDPMPESGCASPVLMPNGDLMVAGGYYQGNYDYDNFAPVDKVYLLRMPADGMGERAATLPRLFWIMLAVVLLIIVVFFVRSLVRKKESPSETIDEEEEASLPMTTPGSTPEPEIQDEVKDEEMIRQLRELMETERLFLNPELKVSDVANRLGTNTRYVAACVRMDGSPSFSQYVNGFRVRHAQRLLSDNTERKISVVSMESGFSNEQTFFRIFKSATGMTPKEWMQQNKQ